MRGWTKKTRIQIIYKKSNKMMEILKEQTNIQAKNSLMTFYILLKIELGNISNIEKNLNSHKSIFILEYR